jgi:hypothetical protein
MDFIKYRKIIMEINQDISKEIEDIKFKINFINNNSIFKIKYNVDEEQFLIEVGNETEFFRGFNLKYIVRKFFHDVTSDFIYNDIERDNYIQFKNRLNEIYNKVKFNIDLNNKLQDLNNKLQYKRNKEKRIKI